MPAAQQRDSRGLILRAAREEFGRYGFAGGRVDRIAHRAGVNKQLIFYYYGSKQALYQSVLESASRDIAAAAAAPDLHGAPPEQLRGVAARVFSSVADNGDLVRMSLLATSPDGGTGALLGNPLERLTDTIRRLVSEGQGLGYVRDDVDPETIARLVLATAVGCLALEGPPAKELREAAIDLVTRALAW